MQTANLKKNLELLNRYCGKLHIVFLPQVLNLEDELTRCTNVKNVSELTRSNSIRNFNNTLQEFSLRWGDELPFGKIMQYLAS